MKIRNEVDYNKVKKAVRENVCFVTIVLLAIKKAPAKFYINKGLEWNEPRILKGRLVSPNFIGW